MARLFPKIDPSEIENPGERKVAQALVEQLPSRVEVFHSFAYLSQTRQGRLLEGECDFVILDPDNGLLFVEVKGGSLEFNGQHWLRELPSGGRRRINKDPFAQAGNSMHEITERVRQRFPGHDPVLPFTYGYAVAFPDCCYSGALPVSIHPDLVLDANKCRDLGVAVQRVFERFSRGAHPRLDAMQLQAIHEALLPRFAILPVIWRKVEDQEERLRRLTEEQQRLLDFLGSHNKAAIRGVAGSGKTILALAKAQEMARRGQRTLFLCYNRLLRDWLRQAIPDTHGDGLVIDTYHGLVSRLCKAAEIPLWEGAKANDPDFWDFDAPDCLIQACERLPPEQKFDSVIVDEGQDFQDLWWTSLDDVFRDPANKGCYYVFYDPNQNLFVEKPMIPAELGSPFELPVNCRNTVSIASHCAALVDTSPQVRDGAPVGDEPSMTQVTTLQEGFREAGRQVRSWCIGNAGGLRLAQVAVLAPGGSKRDWPQDFKNVAVTEDLERWRRNEGVLLTTWGRFKGLEADAIVILETPMNDDPHENANRYVARSRAKHLLTVIDVGPA